MSQSTDKLNLVLPAGGSTGTIPGSEEVDIDVLNENFRKIDDALGIPRMASTARPAAPFDTQTIIESDTGNMLTYSSSAGRWIPVGTPNAASDSLRDALFPAPNQSSRVYRTDLGYVQIYRLSSDGITGTTGWYREDERKYVFLTASALQDIPTGAVVVKLNLQTEVKKTDVRLHDTTNHTRLKAPVAGIYELTAQVWLNSASGVNLIGIYKNGALDSHWRDSDVGTSGVGANLRITEMFTLAANDYLEIAIASADGDDTNSTRVKVKWERIL